MAVTSDIVESWRRPRVVLRRHLARGKSEAFAFSLLFVFLLMAFIAQYPGAARVSARSGTRLLSTRCAQPLSPMTTSSAIWRR